MLLLLPHLAVSRVISLANSQALKRVSLAHRRCPMQQKCISASSCSMQAAQSKMRATLQDLDISKSCTIPHAFWPSKVRIAWQSVLQRSDIFENVSALAIQWLLSETASLQADVKDASGLTALHLAAIAPDESLAERLLQACKCSAATWFTASAADGLTPAHFAARLNRHGLNARILLLAQAEKVKLFSQQARISLWI